MMKRKFMVRLGLVLLAAAMAVATVGTVLANAEGKVVKPFAQYGQIVGEFSEVAHGSPTIAVLLLRVEKDGLAQVGITTTKGGGKFSFDEVPPGTYLVQPDLSTLPDGIGLYRRHELVTVHQEPTYIALKLGRIHRLSITAPERVPEEQSFSVEAHAYDAADEYLFAHSEVVLPDEAKAVSQENSPRITLAGRGRSHRISARNGSVTAEVLVTVE